MKEYKYFNGKETITKDSDSLTSAIKNHKQIGEVRNSTTTRKFHDTSLDLIRNVFEIEPFENGGLSERECFMLMRHFLESRS